MPESLVEQGYQKRINIFLPVDLWRRLRTRAAETDALISTVVAAAIEQHLREPQRTNALPPGDTRRPYPYAKSQDVERG